ncbi:MAG: hypothetical protein ABW298_08655 [Candidatus Binatia bacterium]
MLRSSFGGSAPIPPLFTPFAATFADVTGLVIHFTVALVVIHRSML